MIQKSQKLWKLEEMESKYSTNKEYNEKSQWNWSTSMENRIKMTDRARTSPNYQNIY